MTLDCYGTLIDWESGIWSALRPLAARAEPPRTRDQVLESFARHEAAQEEETPAMPYSDLLSVVYRRLATEWRVPVTNGEANKFGASIPEWPAFPDSVEALRYLKQHYKLVILSNVDRTSFRSSNERLQVAFDAVYTAQDIGSYKPSVQNFQYMLGRLREDFGAGKADILHVAQSLFHDHAPAKHLGLASAWIDRRHAAEGWGATVPPRGTSEYDFRFDSLGALVEAHRQEANS